jgi:anti-sigma factor (TIGR02949 family)
VHNRRKTVAVNDIDCAQALKRLIELVDQELGDAEREVIEHHLQTCRSCLSRAEFERALKGKLRGLSHGDVPSKTLERITALMQDF